MTMKLLLSILLTLSCYAQEGNFGCTGNGIGHSAAIAIDCDGDGYGVGPTAIIQTTSSTAVTVGLMPVTTTVTLASGSGTIVGTTTNGSNIITLVADPRALQSGEGISGTGIPSNTTVTGIVLNTGANTVNVQISNNATASGSVTLTISIGVGTVLRYDGTGTGALVSNTERITCTAVTSNTCTATFYMSHASGVNVLDQGVLGPDADDHDPLVWTYTQLANKYDSGTVGSLPNSRVKLANDWILENAYCGTYLVASGACQNGLTLAASRVMTAAMAAGISNPHAIWYLGAASAMAPFGAASDSNNCSTISTPCLTVSRLNTEGMTTSDLIFLGPGWDGRLSSLPNGTSSKYATVMAYPGTIPALDASVSSANIANILDNHYLSLLGTRYQNGSYIGGGTAPFNSVDSEQVFIAYNDMFNCAGSDGCINADNGLNNWIIEYNVTSYNTNQHGIYIGAFTGYSSCAYCSTQVVVRRNLFYGNNYSGLHWNGGLTYGIIEQNIGYNNASNGISLQGGFSYGFVLSNLLFGNGAFDLQFYDYQGSCGDTTQGPQQYICPADQNHNLVANNTMYNFSHTYGAVQIASDTNGCVVTASTCPSPVLVGDLGNNTFRNNIFVGYGNTSSTGHYPLINYPNCNPGTSNYFNGGTTYPYIGPCTNDTSNPFLSTSTWDHNLYYETGPNATSAIMGYGPASSGSGWQELTCSAAGAIGTVTTCLSGNPQFIAASITQANWSGFDFRLSTSSPAWKTCSTTGVPAFDLLGRAFLDDTPSCGAMERSLFTYGWNDLGANTKMQYISGGSNSVPSDGAPSNTNNISLGGSGGSCPGGNCYPFSTQSAFQIDTWTAGVARDSIGITKELCWWGGGHSDWIGNELYCVTYNSGSRQITRIIGPSTFVGDPGTGATFTSTISGGVMTACAVNAGGSGYIGSGRVLWSSGAAIAEFTESGGVANSCTVLTNSGSSGYGAAPTGSTPVYNTPALLFAAGLAVPQLSDGSANTIHSTGSLSYDPTRDQFLKWNGAVAGGNGAHFGDTFAFLFGSTAWSRLDPTGCGSGCATNTVGSPVQYPLINLGGFASFGLYDAASDSHFYYQDQSSGGSLGVYVPSGNTLSPLSSTCTGCWINFGYGVPDIGGAATANGIGFDIIPSRRLSFYIGSNCAGGGCVTPLYQAFRVNIPTATGCSGGSSPCSGGVTTLATSPSATGTSGTNTITVSGVNGTISNGMAVSGTGIGIGAVVTNVSGTTITVSVNNSGTVSGFPTFSSIDSSCNGWWQASNAYAPGLQWNPSIAQFVAFPANVSGTAYSYYTMDPDALTCATYSLSSGPPQTGKSPAYIYTRFRYAPSIDAMPLMQDYAQDAFVLSLNAPDPTGPAPTQTGTLINGSIVMHGTIMAHE